MALGSGVSAEHDGGPYKEPYPGRQPGEVNWRQEEQNLHDEIKQLCPEGIPEEVEAAFEFAVKIHRQQMRQSGDIYLSHPVEVAKILAAEMNRQDLVGGALLHDTVERITESPLMAAEYFEQSPEEIYSPFGKDALTTVFLASHSYALDGRRLTDRRERSVLVKDQLEEFGPIQAEEAVPAEVEESERPYLWSPKEGKHTEEERVKLLQDALLIRIADRLHNLRTIEYLGPNLKESRRQKILRILDDTEYYIRKANELSQSIQDQEKSIGLLNVAEELRRRVEEVRLALSQDSQGENASL